MRKEYDFTKGIRIPRQSLINLYLRNCAAHSRKLDLRLK